jgi:hypothetical protein
MTFVDRISYCKCWHLLGAQCMFAESRNEGRQSLFTNVSINLGISMLKYRLPSFTARMKLINVL